MSQATSTLSSYFLLLSSTFCITGSIVSLLRVFMRLLGVIPGGVHITLAMSVGSHLMGFRCRFVMFRSLIVFVFRH